MIDVFYEETVLVHNAEKQVKKHNLLKKISLILFGIGFLLFVIVFLSPVLKDDKNASLKLVILTFPIFIIVLLAVIFWFKKNNYCNEYDYSFVSGSIRIAKIINRSKRQFYFEFTTKAIAKLGKCGSGTYNKYATMDDIKKVVLTSNDTPEEGKDFFYIVAHVQGEKKLIIFECTEEFMRNVLKFSNRTVLEEDYKRWFILIMPPQLNRLVLF